MNGLAEPTRMAADVEFDEIRSLGMIEDVAELQDYLTTAEAHSLAESMGSRLSRAAISEAARRWRDSRSETGIEGAKKVGNTWLIPRTSFLHWLETRQPRGPEPRDQDCA
jgi:hypothetical protein